MNTFSRLTLSAVLAAAAALPAFAQPVSGSAHRRAAHPVHRVAATATTSAPKPADSMTPRSDTAGTAAAKSAGVAGTTASTSGAASAATPMPAAKPADSTAQGGAQPSLSAQHPATSAGTAMAGDKGAAASASDATQDKAVARSAPTSGTHSTGTRTN